MPRLVSIMKSCWVTEPAERPLASEVVRQLLDDPSCLLLYREAEPDISLVQCVGWPSEDEVR